MVGTISTENGGIVIYSPCPAVGFHGHYTDYTTLAHSPRLLGEFSGVYLTLRGEMTVFRHFFITFEKILHQI